MRFLQFIAAAALTLASVFAPAHAEKRVALVIGNGAYRHADKLANPVNDARGMRDALTELKFDVIYDEDVDGKALRRLIARFAGVVDSADVALVYFAGHGATFGDVPYVVPVDAEFSRLDEMPAELVTVEDLIADLRRAKNVRIAIFDACRDNAAEQALKTSRGGSPSRGLVPPKNPAGLIIAYATQHGATAADDAGGAGLGGPFPWGSPSARHSPFTAALLHNIAAPGIDVTDMFRKVGREVDAATSGRQRPELSISMYEQYALVPSAAPPPAPAVVEAAQVWDSVKDTTSVEAIDDFIRRYGQVPVYGPLSRTKRQELAKLAEPPAPPPRPGPAPLTAERERGLKQGDSFRECENCPEMVVVPAGSFTMGSPAREKERYDNEGPQHVVNIGRPFAMGKYHVTVDQFAVFAKETGYKARPLCDWRRPGFTQDGSHPVVCVSWDDANAYAKWLADKTGKPYRLPSEAEWEYAARAGTKTPFWWGSSITPAQASYNGTYVYAGGGSKGIYRQGTVPVSSFEANPWGLYNVHGNAWQWTADCWHDNYNSAPTDGSAWVTCSGSGSGRVTRGGSWNFIPRDLRASARGGLTVEDSSVGFRLARTLP